MKIAFNRERFKLYLWIGLAWFLLWEFHYLVTYPAQFFPRTINEIWRDAYIVLLNFILFENTIPFITRKRKYIITNILLGIFVLWVQIMFYSFGLFGWRSLGILLQVYTPYRIDPNVNLGVTYQFQFAIGSIFFFGIIRHIYDYRKLKETAQKLRIEKQEAELNYLKSQTNPHFLFNTLNNIYSLARDKSDLAPESILRLSKILRFMLYEAGGYYIAIEQELKIISDYIALEQLRYDESLHINLNHDIEDIRQAIPPLLLIPLVENAFKHGVSETRGRSFVDIHLSVRQRQLNYIVKNSSEAEPGEAGIIENIGLSNLRRQLELLYKDYQLSVHQADAVFTVTLKINLASHV